MSSVSAVYAFLIVVFLSARTLTVNGSSSWRGPRDRFWRHHVEDQTLVYKGVEYYQPMVSCLNAHLSNEEQEGIKTSKSKDRAVGLKHRDGFRQNKVILLVIEHSMTPLHVKAVQALATCVRTVLPDEFYEARSFYMEMGYDEDPGLGGNNPTHLAPLLGVFFPAVVDEMQRTLELAYETAGWSYFDRENATKHHLEEEEILPKPDEVGFRASEHLTYKDFKEGLADHTDGRDTFYTINFAFSGPHDYDGGFFYLKYGEGALWGDDGPPPREQLFLKPNKYDCLVFLGGPYLHGVTEMTGGNREMFSSELWNYPDTPFGSNLWSNEAYRMEVFIEKCNRQKVLQCRHECNVDMTKLLPEDNGLMEEEKLEVQGPVERWCDLETGKELIVSDFEAIEKEPTFMVPLASKELQPIYWRQDFFPVHHRRVQVAGLTGNQLVKSFFNNPLHTRLIKLAREYDSKHSFPRQSKDGWRVEPMSENNGIVKLTPTNEVASQALLQVLQQDDEIDSILKRVASSLQRHPLALVDEWHIVSWKYAKEFAFGPATNSNETVRLLIPLHIPSSANDAGPEDIFISIVEAMGSEMYWGDLHLLQDRILIFVGGNDASPILYALDDSEFESDDQPFLLSMVVRFLEPKEAEKHRTTTAPFLWQLLDKACPGEPSADVSSVESTRSTNCFQEVTV